MTEEQYITEMFEQKFSKFCTYKIALYGLGDNTKIILNKFDKYNIVGVLDGYREEGIFEGKNILKMQDISSKDVQVIIIVARTSSTKIIWERIREECIKKEIRVFDLFGQELSSSDENKENKVVDIPLSYKFICGQIERYDAISFDIFDTLLVRKCNSRENIYRMIAEKHGLLPEVFLKQRIKAELAIANQQPTLNEIYKEMATLFKYTNKQIEEYCKTEEEIEEEMALPNKRIIDLLLYASKIGKRIFLVSDMYLSKKQIEKMLIKNEISGYENIFVSCEYRTGKRQKLFSIFKEKVGSGRFLHIGDDLESDGMAAMRNQIDTIMVYSNISCKDFYIGYYSSKIKLHISQDKQIGYCLLGPVVTEFVFWLIKKVINQDFNKILFLARDGYLLKKMYDRAVDKYNLHNKVPHSIYFLFSRNAGTLALTNENNFTQMFEQPFSGSIEELLMNRYTLPQERLEKYVYSMSTQQIIEEQRLDILEKAKEAARGFNEYTHELNLELNKKTVVVDLVSTGTCQWCLEGLMKNKSVGMYLMRMNDSNKEKQCLHIESYFSEEMSIENGRNIQQYYMIIESLIKELHGSVKTYESNGKIIYKDYKLTQEHIKMVSNIQEGILEYFEEVIGNVELEKYKLKRDFVDGCLGYFSRLYSYIDIDQWKSYQMKDEYRNRDISISKIN